MIEVSNLSKRYGQRTAIKNINFSIKKGEIVGFLGLNGAGKSTTMNILTGYISSTDGEVKIGGYDILEEPLKAKKMIGYLPEIPPLYLDMTVKEYLEFVYDLKKVKIKRNKHIQEVCQKVQITDMMGRIIKHLSKGYKQRVGLAQALIGNPDVLILDEPTVGLDPKQILHIRNLIKELGKSHTIILSSHILSEIQSVCKRVIILSKGKVVADSTMDKLTSENAKDNSIVIRAEGEENKIFDSLNKLKSVKEVSKLGLKEEDYYDFRVSPKDNADIRKDIFECAKKNNFSLLSMETKEINLEEIFLKLTSEDFSHTEEVNESSEEIVNDISVQEEAIDLTEQQDNNISEGVNASEEDTTNQEEEIN